ncbi:PLP-dependent aminotransferase family protein [Salegentibacter salarius]|uniref:hypothetical protein n=1 Tax=Salegentibacter salarius TaxID=435906 RepID=UPI0009C63149|nr:hypothetical protein [Salegentibacter salarius]SLJ89420.1 histidine decarboxylase [Salegentibacter salarius]
MKARYLHGLEVAEYCKNQLKEIGVEAWSNPGSLTVVMPRTPDAVKQKWQLATEGEVSHIICMPNVTKNQIDEFIQDLAKAEELEEEDFGFDL